MAITKRPFIIDSQVHIWEPDRPERPWPAGRTAQGHRVNPLGADELLAAMDDASVDRVVIVPPSWEGDRNDLALRAAAAHPDRFAVMGRFPLESRSEASVAGWRQQPGMLGIRLTFHRPPWRQWFTAGAVDWFWPAAERAGLPVMVLGAGLTAEFGAIAERHPGLRLIVDHLAIRVGTKDDEAFATLGDLFALARFPNVAVKASALPCYTDDPYPFPRLHRHIRAVYETFGPRRMLWGTDYSRLPCSYADAIRLFTEGLDFLTSEDKGWIMGRAAATWLDWPLP